MTTTTAPILNRFTRFDKIVFLIIGALLTSALLIVSRGDQVGLQVERITPAAGSVGVSTQAVLRVTFDQDVRAEGTTAVTLSPPLPGTVQWENQRTLAFVPDDALTTNTDYTVTIEAQLTGQQGRKLLHPVSWQFRTGEPRLLYIAWDEARSGNQLYSISPDGNERTQLTQEPINILDYAVSPDGQLIAYTSIREDGGSDLWLIQANGQNRRLLLACPEGACSEASWSSNGHRLIYERRAFLEPGAPVGPPRLWWLDVVTGETTAVFQDSQWIGLGVRFSPDNQWISYAALQTQEIQAYNLETGRNIIIKSQTGEPPSWSPLDNTLLVTQVQLDGSNFSVHILHVNTADNTITNLSGDIDVNDSWPTFSPNGEWIAFTRKTPRTATGKQVWLMRPDGTEAVNLTQNDDLHFGPPSWSPDGRFLTFQGYSLTEPDQPGIWLYDLESHALKFVTTPGIRPTWLP